MAGNTSFYRSSFCPWRQEVTFLQIFEVPSSRLSAVKTVDKVVFYLFLVSGNGWGIYKTRSYFIINLARCNCFNHINVTRGTDSAVKHMEKYTTNHPLVILQISVFYVVWIAKWPVSYFLEQVTFVFYLWWLAFWMRPRKPMLLMKMTPWKNLSALNRMHETFMAACKTNDNFLFLIRCIADA